MHHKMRYMKRSLMSSQNKVEEHHGLEELCRLREGPRRDGSRIQT